MPRVELLSPAGDMSALTAAVENGADAVYLGAKELSARRGAQNFDADELKYAVKYCHERLVRVYVAVNTVIKQRELHLLESVARQIADAGADAVIIQDFGVARAFKQMLPSLKMHASTQMAIHNAQGCAWAKQYGFARVVPARELTYAEIRECADTGIEIEAFCHGALCSACSGQCLFSSIVGGRSGNRGACAQPCRLPYTLKGPYGESEGYLLSTKDLMTLDSLDALKRAGVSSLKIEGRLKRPEYVAIVTRAYRRALDGERMSREDINELAQIYNRGGFTSGYAAGVRDRELISRERPNHAGLKIGTAARGRVNLDADVLAADELVIRAQNGEDTPVTLSGSAGDSVVNPVDASGDLIRLTSAAQLKRARESFNEITRQTPIDICLRARVGERVSVLVTDGERRVELSLPEIVQIARKQAPLADIRARALTQIKKTGGTPLSVRRVDIDISEDAFLSVSTLNMARRAAVNAILNARATLLRGCDIKISPFAPDAPVFADMPKKPRLTAESARVRSLEIARSAGADDIVYAPNDLRVESLNNALDKLNRFYLMLPPVACSGDLHALNKWVADNAHSVQGVYITNVGQLALDWYCEIRLDYMLNIANDLALRALGAHMYTPSVELNAREINDISGEKELFVYGTLPLMRLRHCPLSASVKNGAHSECDICARADGDKTINACALTDRRRVRFKLSRTRLASGCVIDVNNSVRVMLLKHIKRLPKAIAWRMRFTDEPDARVSAITRLYRMAADGLDFTSQSDWSIIGGEEYTTGHYFRGVE